MSTKVLTALGEQPENKSGSFHVITLGVEMEDLTPEFLADFKEELAQALGISSEDITFLGIQPVSDGKEK